MQQTAKNVAFRLRAHIWKTHFTERWRSWLTQNREDDSTRAPPIPGLLEKDTFLSYKTRRGLLFEPSSSSIRSVLAAHCNSLAMADWRPRRVTKCENNTRGDGVGRNCTASTSRGASLRKYLPDSSQQAIEKLWNKCRQMAHRGARVVMQACWRGQSRKS